MSPPLSKSSSKFTSVRVYWSGRKKEGRGGGSAHSLGLSCAQTFFAMCRIPAYCQRFSLLIFSPFHSCSLIQTLLLHTWH